MAIKTHKCPKCSAALQLTRVGSSRMRVCRCGHGEPIPTPSQQRNMITYIQDLTRASITQLKKKV